MAKAKSDTESLILAAIRKAKLVRLVDPIAVRIIWYAADARKRDVDSLAVLAKSCLDALKKGKVINDDHAGIVYEVTLGPIVISRDHPRIEIHLRGMETRRDVSDGRSGDLVSGNGVEQRPGEGHLPAVSGDQ